MEQGLVPLKHVDSRKRFEDSENIWSAIEGAIQKAKKDIGTVNVLITGRTGVGKSTLINEIFEGRLAETGQGEPVTRETCRLTKQGIPLAIYDTRGLELEEYRQIIDELMEFVDSKHKEPDASQHVHVSWMCVSEDGRRVEDAEIALHQRLAEFMPVLGVITKARSDQGFKARVQDLLPKTTEVVRVRALSERFDDVDTVLPAMGLEDLVDATIEVIPKAVQRAFAAAQKASIALKKKRAHSVVNAAALVAGGVGATPIPFADAVLLVPVQIGMLAGISATFGLELSKAFLGTLVTAMAGTTAATVLGQSIVSNLLKFIPGLGSIFGGAIAATTASALTKGLGEIYITVLDKLFTESEGDAPSQEAIAQELKDRLAKPKRGPASTSAIARAGASVSLGLR